MKAAGYGRNTSDSACISCKPSGAHRAACPLGKEYLSTETTSMKSPEMLYSGLGRRARPLREPTSTISTHRPRKKLAKVSLLLSDRGPNNQTTGTIISQRTPLPLCSRSINNRRGTTGPKVLFKVNDNCWSNLTTLLPVLGLDTSNGIFWSGGGSVRDRFYFRPSWSSGEWCLLSDVSL